MPSKELLCATVLTSEMQGDIHREFLERPVLFCYRCFPFLKADVMPGGAAATLQSQGEKHQKKAKANHCKDGPTSWKHSKNGSGHRPLGFLYGRQMDPYLFRELLTGS